MSPSRKIPATDRSAGGPGSSHVNRDAPEDAHGAHHQDTPAERKHPGEQKSTGGGGNVHEQRRPGEGGRA